MSSVVINNIPSISNQKVKSIEENKLLLAFNVTKEQLNKLRTFLEKVSVTFEAEPDKLSISNLSYNGVNIKTTAREISASKMTLPKTYVVTMKQSFISKVQIFYDKIIEKKNLDNPVFGITREINLQEALQEATTEINLSELNKALSNSGLATSDSNKQVLANNPLGDTIIERPIKLNREEQPVSNNNIQEVNSVEGFINQETTVTEHAIQPKVKSKRLKGNVLVVPIIIVWLGLVLVGTVKLVTHIMT